MSNVVPTRELVRLQGLQVKVGQLLVKNKLSEMLKDDLSRLYDALELSVAKLDDLNLQGIPLDSIDSVEIRHDIRNAIGITKGYAELIKDTAEEPSATLSNLLDKIMLWSAKTISTLERTRRKQTDSNLFAMTALKPQHSDHRGHILILDDEPANRELLSRHIQQLGLETFACATADEAYDVLRNNDIDLNQNLDLVKHPRRIQSWI